MKTWNVSVCVLGSVERWFTEVKSSDRHETLQKALDIFLATEDRENVEFDSRLCKPRQMARGDSGQGD